MVCVQIKRVTAEYDWACLGSAELGHGVEVDIAVFRGFSVQQCIDTSHFVVEFPRTECQVIMAAEGHLFCQIDRDRRARTGYISDQNDPNLFGVQECEGLIK